MISYMIKGGLHTYSFISNLFAAMPGPKNPFETLHSPNCYTDLESFVNSYHLAAKTSDQPSSNLSRCVVKIIGLNKAGLPVEHESFVMWVYDTVTHQEHEFIVERVPSDRSYTFRFSLFSHFPASQTVLDSIHKAIRNMRALTAQAANSLFVAIKTETETVSLLPLTSDTETFPETETIPSQSSNSPPSTISQINSLSLTDKVTSTLAGAVATARAASQSISPQRLARDTISGCPPGTLIVEDCIRKFSPVNLSVFDVVLLAMVVHQHAPIYGLFDNQCYMFASVMFDAIVQLYSLPAAALDFEHASTSTPTSGTPVPAPTPEVGAPKNANVVVVPSPDQAGRWSGLLIIDPIVKATIVSIVTAEFRRERALYAL